MEKALLEIENLHVKLKESGEEIIKGLNLKVEKGEVHALMGPNGSGKSTLANVIMGHPGYKISSGKIFYNGEDITELKSNERFSGGEKKKSEILQMAVLNPKFAILDETDSGLDIDALKIVANGINNFKSKEKSILIITHYKRILEFIKPDKVSIMVNGKVVLEGDGGIIDNLEERGYKFIENNKIKNKNKKKQIKNKNVINSTI